MTRQNLVKLERGLAEFRTMLFENGKQDQASEVNHVLYMVSNVILRMDVPVKKRKKVGK
jgi:hypothetical protein